MSVGLPTPRRLEVRSGEPARRDFDAIVIGSGMSGLTSALVLAKEGMRVVVLEQHYRPGGFLHRFFRKGGVQFDVGFHYLGGIERDQVLGIYFNYLGILDDIEFLPLDPEGYDEVIFPHTRFLFPAGTQRLVARCSERFPKERAAIARYFAEQREICAGFGFYNISREQNEAHAVRWLGARLGDYMRRHFDDPELIQILLGQNPLYGVEPERAPVALHALVTDSFTLNPYAVRGGGEGIVRPLVARIEALGGDVRTKCRVAAIDVDDTRQVRGVRTVAGETLRAPLVLCSAHPKAMVRMLPDKVLRRGYRRRVLAMEDGIATLSLFATTQVDLSGYAGRNIYHYKVREVDGIYDRRPRPFDFVFFTVPTAREGRSPAGLHHVVGLGLLPWEHIARWESTRTGARGDEYEAYKRAQGERLLELICEAAPELRGNIESFEVATPLTNRDYACSERGAAYGIHHSVDQVGRYGLRPRTRVSGLYMTGQSVLMPGVCGVTISAFHSCAQILGQDYLIGKVQAYG